MLYSVLTVCLVLLLPLGGQAQTLEMGTLQSVITDATDCITNQTTATLGQRCYQLSDSQEFFCENPSAGGNTNFCDTSAEWGRMSKVYTHATNCRANVTNGSLGDICWDESTGQQWGCNSPSGGGAATICDNTADWRALGSSGSVITLQSAFDNGKVIGNADSEANALQVGNSVEGIFKKEWATSAGFFSKVTPAADTAITINTGKKFALYGNDSTTLRWSVTEAGALDVSGLTSATGAFPVSNLGLSFAESDTNPTCTSGDFRIYADLSENKLKKCENGTAADLDTGGTSGELVVSNLGINFTESDTNPACAAGDFRIYSDLSENKLKKCENGTLSDMDTGGSATSGTGLTLTPSSNNVNTLLIENTAGGDLISFGSWNSAGADGTVWFGGNVSTTNYGIRGSTTQTMINAATSTLIQQASNTRLAASSAGIAISPQLRFTYGSETVALQKNATDTTALEVNNTTQGLYSPLYTGFTGAATATINAGHIINTQSTGTPAAGFGGALTFQNESSTTVSQDAARISVPWEVATHASRTADIVMELTNSGTLGEVMRLTPVGMILAPVTANPTAAQLGTGIAVYRKGTNLVFAYSNAGTATFVTLALDGSDVSLTHNSTPP